MHETQNRVHPQNEYDFKTNADFRSEWHFLPRTKQNIIATQLTYLSFHGWLKSNLCHRKKDADEWEKFILDVDEGFHRTDLLLFVAVIEAALHCVLKALYEKDPSTASLKSCFEISNDKFIKLNDADFTLAVDTGKLTLRIKKSTPKKDSAITLKDLIEAGEKLGIYIKKGLA